MRNAIRFLKEANVDAIKLEGGVRTVCRVRAILDAGVAVCGHIGLTPQSSGQLGGHKAQGRTLESAKLVVEDARALYEAGVQLLLVEAVPPEVAGFIRNELPIPVLGIGAGEDVDGQLLIVSDVLGTFQAFTPKFVKKYADLAGVVHGRAHRVRQGRARQRVPRRSSTATACSRASRTSSRPGPRAEAGTAEGTCDALARRRPHPARPRLRAGRPGLAARDRDGLRRLGRGGRARRARDGRSTRSTSATSTSPPRSPSWRR